MSLKRKVRATASRLVNCPAGASSFVGTLLILLQGICCGLAQPDNDAFANRLTLSGTNVVFDAYLLDATLEPGEPNHAQPSGIARSSIWWSWTAPSQGVLEVVSGNFSMALYQGSAVTSLSRVTNWHVQGGQTYQLVAFDSGLAYVNPSRTLLFHPPPPNDHFTNSILLEGSNPHFEGWTHGATREPGETAPGAGTLWWRWRAPADGVARLVTSHDSFFGAAFGIFQGEAVSALKPVPYVYGPHSDRAIDVKAGELYYFLIASATGKEDFRFTAQVILSPLRIESPLTGTVYPAPTDVVVQLSSAYPPTAFGGISISTSNGYYRIESPQFTTQMVFSNLPAGQYSIRAWAADHGHMFSYLSQEVSFRVLLPNDDFANSTVLEGTNVLATGDMRHANSEPGEIDNNGSIWWRWTAPVSGWAIVDSFLRNTPLLQVFRGEELSALSLISRRPESAGATVFGFPAEQGVTYHIRATGDALPSYPADLFRLNLGQAPVNDAFANRVQLTGDRNHLEALLLLATPETNEPAAINNPDFSTVWYTWTAPSAGVLGAQISKANDWRDGVAVFSGNSLSTLKQVGLPAQVQPGQTCQIALYGNRYFKEPISADLLFFPYAANDSFDTAQVLPGVKGEVRGQTGAATGEPAIWDGQYNTVWYAWTAPSNGALTIETSELPPGACCRHNSAVYIGSALDPSGRVDYRSAYETFDTNGNPACWVRQWDVQAGTTYHVVMFAESFVIYPFLLKYQFDAAPDNDVFESRTPLNGKRCAWSGSNRFASHETGEPVAGQTVSGRSLWWQWMAPTNGWGWFSAESTNFVPLVRVYEGTTLTNLSEPWGEIVNGLSELWFQAEAGQSYVLLLDDPVYGGSGGEFTAALELTTARVVISNNQDPDFTAPRQVSLELSKAAPDIEGQLVGARFWIASNLLGVATSPPFSVQTPTLDVSRYTAFALATNKTGEVWHCAPCDFRLAPTNDLFARRQPLSGRRIQREGTVAGAGREPGEPLHSGSTNGYSVWYEWQARADGEVTLSSPAISQVEWAFCPIGIYTGESVANLETVPRILDRPGSVRFLARRGQTYEIAVEGFTDEGFLLSLSQQTLSFIPPEIGSVFVENQPITLEVSTTEPLGELAAIDFLLGDQVIGSVTTPPYRFVWTNAPPGQIRVVARGRLTGGQPNPPLAQIYLGVVPINDSYATRQPVSGTNVLLHGDSTFARPQEGQPASGSVWYSWTAPWSGYLHLEPPAGMVSPRLVVFTNNPAGQLVQVAMNVGNWSETSPITMTVQADTTYQIAASGGEFYVQLSFNSAPSNDDFAHSALMAGQEASLQGSIRFATTEPGEPDYPQFPMHHPAHSLWWAWVAPGRGSIYLTNLSSGVELYQGSLTYAFYTGSSLTNLVPLTVVNNSMPDLVFPVNGGETYHLSINAPVDAIETFSAEFVFVPAPANDQFATRERITGRQTSVPGSTLGATAEPGEPAHLYENAQHSVWYSWTAPYSGIASYQYTSGYPLYAYEAYTGTNLDNLKAIPRVPDAFGFAAQEGVTYAIAVESGDRSPGPFMLSLMLRRNTPPPHDLFANRIALTEGAAPVEGWNNLAKREWLEPRHAGHDGGRSVWYSWTPAASGPAVIRVKADEAPLLIGIYQGNTVTNLMPVAQNASSNLVDEVRFPAQKGREYAIALDGADGATTEFEIQAILTATQLPPSMELILSGQDQVFLMIRDLAGRALRLEGSVDFEQWQTEATYAGGTDDWSWPVPVGREGETARFFRALVLE